MQAMADLWAQQISVNLPNNLDESAKSTGAIKRKRGFKSAEDFLKLLLIFAVSTMSMRMLSLSANSLDISTITDTAWHKRITNCALWLAYILDYILPKPMQSKDEILLFEETPVKNRQIHLVDGSCIAEAASRNMTYRIHMSYNLRSGCMDDIQVTDHHTAESFRHCKIQENHIYMADAGYGKAGMYAYLISQKADAILRFTPSHVILLDHNGQRIDMMKKLTADEPIIDFWCFTKNGKHLLPVRIIASQLPEDKQADAIKRKRRISSKKQAQIMPETLEYAKWIIIMTSLDDQYSAKEILAVYKSRWQIELLFKRIKQHFKVTKIKDSSIKYAKSLILLWLIIWAMVERQSIAAEMHMIKKEMDMSRLSPWTLTSFFFQRVKMIIESLWATIIDPVEDIDIIAQCLQNHKGSRINQYFEYHF
jgi:hypothetical protein